MNEKPSAKGVFRSILEYIVVIIIAIVVAKLITTYVLTLAVVPTGSMEDTIEQNAKILIIKTAYLKDKPERLDIIAFDDINGTERYLLKRVIGLPGETIEGKDGYVYINGNKLEEPYVKDLLIGDFGPYSIPDNKYFVMGDNRSHSNDARYWENKYIDKSDILGKAVYEISPTSKKLDN